MFSTKYCALLGSMTQCGVNSVSLFKLVSLLSHAYVNNCSFSFLDLMLSTNLPN